MIVQIVNGWEKKWFKPKERDNMFTPHPNNFAFFNPPRKIDSINTIIEFFDDYKCLAKFKIHVYEIDLYIPKVKLAIKYLTKDDCDYDIEYRREEHEAIF